MPFDYLLVHGAYHNSAHWAKLIAALSARGDRVVALDLPGHGMNARFPSGYFVPGQPGLSGEPSPIKDVTLEVAAHAVIDALRSFGQTAPVVLVAHSMGGAVATLAAELAPELVDHLVYVAAFVPTRLPTAAAYLTLDEAKTRLGGGLHLGDPTVTGAVRINPRSADTAYLEQLRAAYYTDVSTTDFLPYLNALTPDQPMSFVTSRAGATAARWGGIPRTYLRCAADRAIPLALQDVFISDADALTPRNPFRLATLDTGHAPFASQPGKLAEVLLALPAVSG
ncbi:alpha/beta fold hydrolase [Amycolatopsis pigmentata]|uniref:Alpha/beta fold hydrolase n=1 Tax=Amycolatopsis pigmentata TaxID=450801 RepID=A0ABW5G0T7_9PSEU